MISTPRIALFPDSFFEVNGVANTCRNFAAYARRKNIPMLVVSAGDQPGTSQDGSVTHLTLQRSPLSFRLEKDLRYDLLFLRHYQRAWYALRQFRPDFIHITGPSDAGMLGLALSRRLRIPLAASWHTNVHEYAATRSAALLPDSLRGERTDSSLKSLEATCFQLAALYYRIASFHFAPNPELVTQLATATRRPCALMERGVDHELFTPARRSHPISDTDVAIGYVGRLSTEKNVRLIADLARAARERGLQNLRFRFVGHGSERDWLAANIPNAGFTGVLKGEALAQAYADMDVFAFPSETETFGNVALEALASGVPAVVTDKGGPKFIVEHGRSGYVASGYQEFVRYALALAQNPGLRRSMADEARARALRNSWDNVFDSVYAFYRANQTGAVRSSFTAEFARI